MLAASDTFRAAAIEQLENWANKVEVDITKSSQVQIQHQLHTKQ
jgi:fused signal recognition particle receptor